jgi:hypothetical protein
MRQSIKRDSLKQMFINKTQDSTKSILGNINRSLETQKRGCENPEQPIYSYKDMLMTHSAFKLENILKNQSQTLE